MKSSVFIELGSKEADLDGRLGGEHLQFQVHMKQPREGASLVGYIYCSARKCRLKTE